MSELTNEYKYVSERDTDSIPTFGYELIREILIPELLGPDTKEILYWAGKRIARKFPLESFEQITNFFREAGWGELTIKKENKNNMELELYSSLIQKRLKQNENCTFQLEAGFLAQQLENQQGVITEAFEHPKKRSGKVMFTIKWDKKDPLSTI